MKTLYLMRHAKSSWGDATLSDFERPLNARGLAAAPFMGTLMKERGLFPELILCSPAVRAKATAELLRESAGFDAEIQSIAGIYEASVETLVGLVSEIDDVFDCVLLVGHNPGMEGLICFLAPASESMPTAALAVIDLDLTNWKRTKRGSGELRVVFRPKDIPPVQL